MTKEQLQSEVSRIAEELGRSIRTFEPDRSSPVHPYVQISEFVSEQTCAAYDRCIALIAKQVMLP